MPIACLAGWTMLVLASPSTFASPDDPPARVSPDEDPALPRRYLEALEKNPRRGSALDRTYGLHVERGKLDELIDGYRARTAQKPGDGTAWMVLGLLEAHRGREGAAVPALREAERLRPLDPLASFYLGQALVLTGQPKLAVEAFERSIVRKPSNRNDLLEVYQALGRVHQREQRIDQALAVWARLERQFPDDVRVREKIAAALVEDGQLAPALERYQILAANGEDRLRQPIYRAAAAELKARLGRRPEALAELEQLLDDLPPGEWLQRDARGRLEDIFLAVDDVAGLVGFYEKRATRRPDDLASLVRLAHFLQAQGRTLEARKRLEDSLKIAPTDVSLRRELAAMLAEQQDFAAAAAQYEAIHKLEPANPDVLREWGWLALRSLGKPEPERRKDAASIWLRLLPGPGRKLDASLAEQVADLFRQAGMVDEALGLYRRAVEIAPESASPRTHLGEFLHSLGRKDEAKVAWRAIAAGPNRNARNLRTLADLLADFDDRPGAIAALEEARQLDPLDLGLVLQQADLLARSSKYPEALKVLEVATRLASGPDPLEDVLGREVDVELAGGTLAAHADSMAADLASGRLAGPRAWYRLARFREAVRQWPAADLAVRRALETSQGADRAVVWAAASRIYEGSGRLSEAAEALRQLADLDRKGRPDHLRRVATIETRLGRRGPALAASRDLLAASPGDPTAYRFHASTCLKFDAREEAVDVLRVAVRVDPRDPGALASLAEALVEAGRPEEAIELYWRAFHAASSDDPVGKRNLAAVLARLYLKINQSDRLLERLERLRRDSERDPEARRTLTLCLAQAHLATGELGTARGELERLLPDRPDDVALLQQLVGVAEREGDLTAALRFQRLVAKASPRESQDHLVGLLLMVGEVDEALQLWEHEAGGARDARRLLQLTDNLLFFGQAGRALPTIARALRDRPQDWESLYREGVALASLKRPEEASRRFQAILDLRIPVDQLTALIAPEDPLGSGSAGAVSPLDLPDKDAERAFFDRLDLGRVDPAGARPGRRHEAEEDALDPLRFRPGPDGLARLAPAALEEDQDDLELGRPAPRPARGRAGRPSRLVGLVLPPLGGRRPGRLQGSGGGPGGTRRARGALAYLKYLQTPTRRASRPGLRRRRRSTRPWPASGRSGPGGPTGSTPS